MARTTEKTTEEGWDVLKSEILKAQSQTVPIRRKVRRNLRKAVWLHQELSEKLKHKK